MIHAGNSSQISDGAAALLVTSRERAAELGLVPLAWLAETGADPERLNPLGGAIAVGHPLGASGAILMTRLAHHMRDNGIGFGLQTMCEGGGTANATIVELID